MNQQLVERIRHCPNLPSLPGVAVQILELAQRPDVDIAEIARMLTKDSALAGKILRTVNSSFYARSHPIATLSQALVMLGLQSVKTLVLGFSLVTHLTAKQGKAAGGFNYLDYWKRSIYSATAARVLSGRAHVIQQEEVFLAALLKEIGMLVLDQVLGSEYGDLHAAVASHEDLAAAETAKLGLNHAEAGGILASQWKLPPLLATPIAYHHEPEKVEDAQLCRFTQLVHLSGRCADVFIDDPATAAIADVRRLCHAQHAMSAGEADAMLGEIGRKIKEVAGLFEVNLETPADYETILRRANDALVQLTLQTQQQAAVLEKQAATLREKTFQLTEQNQQLLVKANTDALTGLANRAKFDAFIAEQFASAKARGTAISLLLLDVDHFKAVNDRHGHPAGDGLLQMLGRMLGNAARSRDLAARYGGEEMVLVLPDTARAGASAVAESIRRTVAAKPFPVGQLRLEVTVSIGVASFEPTTPLGAAMRSPAHLIKAADLATYAAKSAGRNCVRVFAVNKPAPAAA